ncbi:MAG TPA: cytosolic protein [bacterium (Candidatus Stahlbacteria)]|nr:cytosolic protein [Candidatus Stahlbacteria bacterium]
MECSNFKQNIKRCNCTYEPCDKKGMCCECLSYHLGMNQLPACCFPDEVERTYDRSIKRFIESRR